MKTIRLIIAIIATIALSACGHSGNFVIKGTIEGAPTMNLRVISYADGSAGQEVVASRSGEFTFTGTAPDGAIVEIYDNDYHLLGRTFARNGDDIELHLTPGEPNAIDAKGNDVAERWGAWLKDNKTVLESHNVKAINDLVAKYTASHDSDPLSWLLIATTFDARYDAPGAAKAIGSLKPEARIKGVADAYMSAIDAIRQGSETKITAIPYRKKGNLTAIFNPHRTKSSLIVFSDDTSGRDSIIDALRRLSRETKSADVAIVDLSLDSDTLVWRRSIESDSATWQQGWVAGAISAQALADLGVPSLPYFIVADSTGRQLWRGSSVNRAIENLKK